MPDARNAPGQFASQLGVEPRLGNSETNLAQERPLFRSERLQFDEQCLGQRFAGQTDAGSAGGAGVGVEHLDGSHLLAQRLAEPGRCQIVHRGRDVQAHPEKASTDRTK
ncbi:hypothetical protein GCM10010533_00930 [Mycolicibacterium pallens]